MLGSCNSAPLWNIVFTAYILILFPPKTWWDIKRTIGAVRALYTVNVGDCWFALYNVWLHLLLSVSVVTVACLHSGWLISMVWTKATSITLVRIWHLPPNTLPSPDTELTLLPHMLSLHTSCIKLNHATLLT